MDKVKLKQKVCIAIDSNVSKIAAYATDVAKEPELGFKETKTAAKMAAVFDELEALLKKRREELGK